MTPARRRPNILLVVADDHAANAVGCYGGPHRVTPNIDRIAAEGIRCDACGCTNSLCSPSRATILTGTYNHVNKVTTLSTEFDNRVRTRRRELVDYYGSGCGQLGASDRLTSPKWELFDLDRDPDEMHSVAHDPAYRDDLQELQKLLDTLAHEVGDEIPASVPPAPESATAGTPTR